MNIQILQDKGTSKNFLRRNIPQQMMPKLGDKRTPLMWCPNKEQTRLLIDNVEDLIKWLKTNGQTSPKLICWFSK